MRWGEIIKRLVLIPPDAGWRRRDRVRVAAHRARRSHRDDDSAGRLRRRHRPGCGRFTAWIRSIPEQFVSWFGQALSGNFGRSISLRQSVFELILARLPATLELALLGHADRRLRSDWHGRPDRGLFSRPALWNGPIDGGIGVFSGDSGFSLGLDPAACVRRADSAAADIGPNRSATRRSAFRTNFYLFEAC